MQFILSSMLVLFFFSGVVGMAINMGLLPEEWLQNEDCVTDSLAKGSLSGTLLSLLQGV